MKLTVIGLGLIGGSIAIDLRARGFAKELTGVEANEGHRARALARKLVDRCVSLDEATKTADLVIVATPVNVSAKILPQILDSVTANATVTDMGSTKEIICRTLASHPKRAQFVASHPMAGTENSGPDAAVAGLFDLKTAVICNREQSGDAYLKRIEELYRVLKMRLVYMSDTDHDLHAAYVSHLSHISSFVLANTVLAKERNLQKTICDLAGGGFESTVRLAKSSPDMWAPIFEQNRAHVLDAIGMYIEELQKFRQSIIAGDDESLRSLMQNANRIRAILTQMQQNFGGESNG